ncbi:YgcG family protein [Aureimonas sp. AU20]|uniref:TPM domain-containing protein n=1 Tax=Aureimonas sp. AU20 TaxID=1349819 RepID=UPI00072115BA|nr:TPM domain-containing protein [Aureimonas sp. AU20]ALN71546.1 hypothetical protein M673_02405 [Aureimonas sp. AU20]
MRAHPARQTKRPVRASALAALWLLALLTLPLFVGFALAGPALAQTFPPLSGRVVDSAGLLDTATKAELTQKLEAFEQRSSDQVVVATVPDLQGYEIADYGYRLGRAWGIGREGENNGVILLVSKNDRRVRIEVGYGLEGTLTDALSRLVIENDILPRFRANDYPGGIRAGTDAILQILGGDAAEVQARAERNAGWQGQGQGQGQGSDGWLSLAVILFILFVAVGPLLAALLSRLFGGGRGGPGSGPDGGSAMPARRRRRAIPISPGWGGGFGGGSGWGGGGSSSGGGFSGGGGSFGGGGSSGSW